jgi:E3 ubiquitin-protein ligase DOA10
VHEKCLIYWLKLKNIRKCELCKTPYIVKEEYGSALDVARKSFNYLFSDSKRLILCVVYALYASFLFRRLYILVKVQGN